MPNSVGGSRNDQQSDLPASPPFSPASDESSSTIDSWGTPPESQSLTKPKYAVASHSVRITKFGYAIEPNELKYPEIIKNISKSSARQSRIAFNSSQIGYKFLNLIRSFWSQPGFPKGQLSEQSQNLTSLLHEFAQNPIYPHKRTFMTISSSSKPQKMPSDFYRSWIPKDKEQLVDLITTLCLHMEDVFSSEPRIMNVPTPCLVLGDIHGNLTDLRTYERSLWPKAPNCVTCNYLFLGDYVDRGDYSIECILYLFAMKLISPKRFFLLRGNHEVAPIQRQYTFSKECDLKFGPSGKDLWKNFNKVFDFMPIAAIIDNQIFCAHGGIPKSINDIKTLSESIPSPLDNPETQCPAAWEILWNDPITDSELISLVEMDNAVTTYNQSSNDNVPAFEATISTAAESRLTTVSSDTSSIASTTPQQIVNDGFIPNIKRGTAYLFSDRAINDFLQVNKLTHIIRAHEVIPTGFAFHGDGRVITIFSSSRYCGLNNQAACILVDQDRIRVLRLDTGDEGE